MAKELLFRIGVNTFKRDTSRFGPAVVGAYIRILLDYFEQGQPPPDDDTVLARIAGCDMEMWKAIRLKLEPLFEIADNDDRGGFRWWHAATDEEIEAALTRKKKSAKAAHAAGDNHALRAALRETITDPGHSTLPPTPPSPKRVDLTTIYGQEEIAAEDDDDLDDEELGPPEPPVPQPVGITFEGPLDPDFAPTAKQIVEYMGEGYSTEQIADVVDEFKRYNLHMGTTSNNWPELWNRWWNRKKPPLHPAEKKQAAKPRVEVSRRAPPPPKE